MIARPSAGVPGRCDFAEGSLEQRSGARGTSIADGHDKYLYGVQHWASCAASRWEGALAGARTTRCARASPRAGQGASSSGGSLDRARTTEVADLEHARRDGFATWPTTGEQARILTRVLGDVRDLRRYGSAALDLSWVGAGRWDAYFESVDKPWDWMAGALIVREAGGRVTELPQARSGHPHIVASAPGVHDALVALLNRAVQPG